MSAQEKFTWYGRWEEQKQCRGLMHGASVGGPSSSQKGVRQGEPQTLLCKEGGQWGYPSTHFLWGH